MGYIIETNNLTKMYGAARGINEVNLAVEEGEIFGFIGPNGAGKSTTIRTLLGLIKKTSGSATIFGLDFEKENTKILEEVGYLPSEVFYYDHMKAIDLLKYSASFYKKDCTKKIEELAEVFELDLHKKIADMSLGNKKKVGIIQGLLHSPKLIILDEPTSGLDPLMQKKFFEVMKKENEAGATILFSSHILSEVQKICNRVAIIKDGTIMQVQKVDELIEDNYKKITATLLDSKQSIEIEGATNMTLIEGQLHFIYKGDCNILIQALAKLDLSNVTIQDPDLEEIFLHYYS
ncbi:MAG: ABC transporter ATP-binding protein [Eubacteriales bacterium]